MSTPSSEDIDWAEEDSLPTAVQLLRRRAEHKPNVIALSDPPNRPALGLGPARSLTYREADAGVDALAAFFTGRGLGPGDIVAMQLPNFALSPLTILPAWRAGVTVALLPMFWRGHEIGRACAEIGPKALIGVSCFGNETPIETLRAVAAAQPSIRFVLGFGPHLPDGVASLDEAMTRGVTPAEGPALTGPALITFTARAGFPFIAVLRSEEELLAQGAMTVLALDLDGSDVILNPYPLTGPAGLSLGFLPWLVSGATLAQHHPFDYGAFAEQILATGATVTALPSPALAELAKDGVPQQPQCRLRRVGAVWTGLEPTGPPAVSFEGDATFFDLYPLGDLAGIVLKRERPSEPASLPLGEIEVADGEGGAVFVETALSPPRDGEGYGEVLLRGPVVPDAQAEGPLAPDGDGFIGTGLWGKRSGTAGTRLELKGDPELLRHGGLAIAASEFDALYRSFPAFLDAACFVLPDPDIGDRVIAAVVPRPDEPVTLEALNRFLAERKVAPYKFPDQIVIVRQIPRDADGRVLREQILLQV
ncbi:MAG TPA: class I adenylate-forming enzyme family protein [Methyloceanibacter sp.]|nr:class I adenylate-forming enzyme family protein [Methyloceanibacter sp.]